MTDLTFSGMLGAGATMKALVKFLTDFITWRWAPAVGLLTASMFYVIVVVGLVPSEIGVPVADAKFETHSRSASGVFGGTSANVETNEGKYGTSGETRPISTPPRPVVRAPAADFGRRGFSPRLDRPEPPPAPSPPPLAATAPAPPPVARGSFGGLFSRIQGALRPGSPAAQSLSEAAQARAQQQAAAAAQTAASTQPAPAPGPPSAAPNAEPAPAPAAPAPPADGNQQQPPDAQQPEGAAPAPSAEAPAAPAQ